MNGITGRTAGWGGSVTVGLAVAALMAGCSSSNPNSVASPRMQAPDAVSRDLTSLRQENEVLKQEQLENTRKIEELQKQLLTEKDEQKRFRQMMSTNFDLLEQSVALTLSKSIENGTGPKAPLVAQAAPAGNKPAAAKMPVSAPAPVTAPAMERKAPAESAAPEESREGEQSAPKEAPAPKTIGQHSMTAGMPLAAAMGTGANRSGASSTAPFVVAATPVAARTMPPAAAPEKPAIKDPDLTPPAKPKTLTANRAAKSLYERGFALYANRQYDQAILVYQNFLSRYPEDIYSDNAQFWIGESYLHLDKLPEAEAAYRKVLREYDHRNSLEGYKTPEAIYRLGTLAAKRKNTDLARYYYGNVAQRFPESSAGRKAQRELEGKSATTAQSEADDDKAGG